MKTIRGFVKNQPVLSFYALVFAIAWGGILILAGGPGGVPTNGEQFELLMPWVMVLWFAGPSVAGIVLTGGSRPPTGRLIALFLAWDALIDEFRSAVRERPRAWLRIQPSRRAWKPDAAGRTWSPAEYAPPSPRNLTPPPT